MSTNSQPASALLLESSLLWALIDSADHAVEALVTLAAQEKIEPSGFQQWLKGVDERYLEFAVRMVEANERSELSDAVAQKEYPLGFFMSAWNVFNKNYTEKLDGFENSIVPLTASGIFLSFPVAVIYTRSEAICYSVGFFAALGLWRFGVKRFKWVMRNARASTAGLEWILRLKRSGAMRAIYKANLITITGWMGSASYI
ncbi:hypothetical protein NP233_g10465 [Leucocoprinus birnbaumii]|uniref:Uncharacterized protein n=1 Tax=Leucocoprinus birnbaumii TaxID=56174 RepID=A0AAD5YPU0_9AGAR|nr:hypothetical protein NP233_g10465 [Leucocoprinus birnbaumii]